MPRGRAYALEQRIRHINKRLKIIKEREARSREYYLRALREKGRFAKFNLKCTCPVCKDERYKRSVLRLEIQKELDKY